MTDREAIEALTDKSVVNPYLTLDALEIAIDALRERAERKTGKWVLSPVDGQLHCSACNRLLWDIAIMALGGLPNACPWCRAEMEAEDADSN